MQITRPGLPGPRRAASPDVHWAATEACETADDGRQTSKVGRLDAGG